MLKSECAIITAYTGVAMLQGEDLEYFYDYVEKILGFRPMTHDFGLYYDEIRNRSRKDFIELCRKAT